MLRHEHDGMEDIVFCCGKFIGVVVQSCSNTVLRRYENYFEGIYKSELQP